MGKQPTSILYSTWITTLNLSYIALNHRYPFISKRTIKLVFFEESSLHRSKITKPFTVLSIEMPSKPILWWIRNTVSLFDKEYITYLIRKEKKKVIKSIFLSHQEKASTIRNLKQFETVKFSYL